MLTNHTNEPEGCTAKQVCLEMLDLLTVYKAQLISLAEEHGLTIAQLHTLRIISRGETAMGQIAKVLHCDASNITGIIDRLIALNLVTRQENVNDRRIKSITLTDKGQETLRLILDKLPTRIGWSDMPSEDLALMHRLIQKYKFLDTIE